MICEHFGRCGGCTYLDIPYEQELKIKLHSLKETLGGSTLETIHPSPIKEGYRNKMELAFGDEGKEGQLAVGMRKRRSFYEVATPTNCVLIPKDFKKIITHVLEFFRNSNETFFHRKRHTGSLRHLILRRGEFTGEILVGLSVTSSLEADLNPLIKSLTTLTLTGELKGIMKIVNDGVADAVKNEKTTILWGQDYYTEKICNLTFNVSMFSFFQTNSSAAEVLYKIVQEYAEQSKLAYDLYCGTGTITQIISPKFNQVIGIEIIEDAIKAAKANAKLNNITNCTFHTGDVLTTLDTTETPNTIIVDPPRDGLHPKTLSKIIEISPEFIIYVACKPASLARDLVTLTKANYTLKNLEAVDMFPRTPHVECIALVCKSEN